MEYIKVQFNQKWRFSHYGLAFKPIEHWMNFCSPQNISGASRQNKVAAFSWKTEAAGDLF